MDSLSKHIADSYKMTKGKSPGVWKQNGILIDTRTCTAAHAEKFIAAGGTVLVKALKEVKAKPSHGKSKK